MHWSQKIAKEIIEKHPDLPEYVVASGISPSGSVHIGNFREFITNYYVGRALQSLGKKVKVILSWDNFDRLRKVPKNIKAEGFEQHIGKPLADIPDPDGECKSYAERFQSEFEKALKTLQMNEIPVKFIYQANEYRSGRYNDQIIFALTKRKEIYDIIMSFKTQDEDAGGRGNYFPISVYCDKCKTDATRVTGCSQDCTEITYQCRCGETRTVNVKTADNIKLVWKVDWPMRWKQEGVVFEAAGPDHMTMGGSYDVGCRLAREIFGIEPPISYVYGFVGIKGLAVKISGSSGNGITPAQIVNIYEPEIIRWLFAKYAPDDFFEFGFDDTIVRHYHEYDCGPRGDEYDKTVFDLALFKNHVKGEKISFGTLATVAPMAEFNEKLIKTMLEKAGQKFTEESLDRIEKVKYWLENYQPDKIYKLCKSFNTEFFAVLSTGEKEALKKLHKFLSQQRNEKEIQEFLYSIINKPELSKKENQALQQRYFKIFYNMLFSRDDGPRLYLYLAAAPREKYLGLLQKGQ